MITIRNLTKSFGDLAVLKDVNADIRKGEVISVIGPSGAGKSTFLRCINLLETPSGGSIEINGTNLLDRKTSVPRIRRRMGMVFQSFNLYAHLTVLDNLTIGPVRLLGKTREEAVQKAMELLRLVGLGEKASNFPHELSGGQKQRVAIARCMAMEPEILLFDEPTSALDPTMVSEVLAVIRRLVREGITMMIVTHEMEFARNVSTRIFYMDDGRIYEEGTPAEIFDNPRLEKTRAFIHRIRSLQHHISGHDYDLYALQGEMEVFCEKHVIPKNVTGFVQLLAEEVLVLQPDYSDITLNLFYSEKDGSVELLCESAGVQHNILEDPGPGNELGVKMIRDLSNSVEYSYKDGKNILLLRVRGN